MRASRLSSGFIGRHPIAPETSTPGAPASFPPGSPHHGDDPFATGSGHRMADYVFYSGTGSLEEGWPDEDKWISFDDM